MDLPPFMNMPAASIAAPAHTYFAAPSDVHTNLFTYPTTWNPVSPHALDPTSSSSMVMTPTAATSTTATSSAPLMRPPSSRACVHEMINGREQQVFLVSDDDDDDDDDKNHGGDGHEDEDENDNDAPPASPLFRPTLTNANTNSSAYLHGVKRKSLAPWQLNEIPSKRRRPNEYVDSVFAPSTVEPPPPATSTLTSACVPAPPRPQQTTTAAPNLSHVSTLAKFPAPAPSLPYQLDAWHSSYGAPPSLPRTEPPIALDDRDGHIIVREGEFITPRYQIQKLLGQGTFGKVVQCYDRKLHKLVAIKVIRAVQKYRDASQIEIRVLRCLRQNDPANEHQCVQLLETFDFRNHVCIVSDLLDRSVFDFLKDNKFQPFPCRDIWLFAKQLLNSVAFLHRLSLIHTDLKPENVLLVDASFDLVATSRRSNARKKRVLRNAEIRLIDFGSATFSNEYHSGVVSTRHYRAPEIILGMGWSFPCDVWSIGCILVEFFTGEALFQTHDNLEHLAMMEMVLGKLPDDYRRKAETYKPEYFYHGHLDYPRPETTKQSRRYVQSMKPLQDIISGPPSYAKHQREFVSLLRRLLEFDPAKRITVEDALKHPYFQLDPNEVPP